MAQDNEEIHKIEVKWDDDGDNDDDDDNDGKRVVWDVRDHKLYIIHM